MDSVSQFALGAAIGHITLSSHLGRRAILVGGIVGSLPDADVIIQYQDAVESFTYHRGFSHSLFVLTAISPIIAWLLEKLFTSDTGSRWVTRAPPYRHWLMFTWLALITHVLLDAFTLYGTQLFWPLPLPPVAIGSIFIIDPIYTLPLIVGLIIAWRANRLSRHSAVVLGLVLSTAYLAITLVVKNHVQSLATESLVSQSLPTDNLLIAPTPLSLAWRVVSFDQEEYHEGYYSVFDDDSSIHFDAYDRQRDWLDKASEHWATERLTWFTHDQIAAKVSNDRLVINDLRMGIEASYVFRFDVGSVSGDQFVPEMSTLMPIEIDTERVKDVVRRVLDESISLRP